MNYNEFIINCYAQQMFIIIEPSQMAEVQSFTDDTDNTYYLGKP